MRNGQITVIILIIILAGIVAYIFGSKKRIGFLWSWFFLCFWGIPGILFIILSPPLRELPPDNPKDRVPNIIFGCLSSLLLLAAIYRLLSTPSYVSSIEGREETDIYNVVVALFFAGSAYYMFNRSDRNKAIYAEFKSKEEYLG